MNSPAAALKVVPVIENPGFTLVEEDDVAFSLTVCREIYRIYATYQSGELFATEPVRAGLLLTTQMFATLQNTVTEGMPALRIEVAAAQTREMMAALFGQGLPSKRTGAAQQDRGRSKGRQAGLCLASTNGNGVGRWAAPEPVNGHHKELPESFHAGPIAPAGQIAPAVTAAPDSANPYLHDRWSAFWRRQKLVVRVAATLLACCFVAVLIDVPFTILAVFPNLLIPLTVAFVVADVCRLLYRMKRPRRHFWSRTTERGAARSARIVGNFGLTDRDPQAAAESSAPGPAALTSVARS
jgi:hypothetical protein